MAGKVWRYRYGPKAFLALKANTLPQPWLHIACTLHPVAGNKYEREMHWAIYVWDTRKILETGKRPYSIGGTDITFTFTKAKDSGLPLDGENSELFNES